MSLKAFVKGNAPGWLLVVLAPPYRWFQRSRTSQRGLLGRQDAMLRLMEQRMAEVERLCVSKVDDFENRLNAVVVPGLLERQDDSLRLIHQELGALQAALDASVRRGDEPFELDARAGGKTSKRLETVDPIDDSGCAAP